MTDSRGAGVPLAETLAIDTEAYYRTYGPMVLRRCRRLLGNEEQAVDAMHDVFVKLLQNQERLDERGPSSLLFRIATNVCLNQLRSRKRHPEDGRDETLDAIAGAPDPSERFGAEQILARVFGTEPVSSRTIAVLFLLDGMTLEEVAAEVGMSVSGVRKRLRGLKEKVAGLSSI